MKRKYKSKEDTTNTRESLIKTFINNKAGIVTTIGNETFICWEIELKKKEIITTTKFISFDFLNF